MASLVHGALPREPEELAEVAPHPDVDHVLRVEVGGDQEPLGDHPYMTFALVYVGKAGTTYEVREVA